MRRTWLGGMLCVGASLVHAQGLELNPNAHFDRDVTGLVLASAPEGGTLAWSAGDLTGRANSGAARLDGPAGAYRVTLCLHPGAMLPWAEYDYAFSATARSSVGRATLSGEVVFMFGGDDPESDGPCNRPDIGVISDFRVVDPEARLAASLGRTHAWPDARVTLTIHKPAGSFTLDALSLTAESDPLLADDFE